LVGKPREEYSDRLESMFLAALDTGEDRDKPAVIQRFVEEAQMRIHEA